MRVGQQDLALLSAATDALRRIAMNSVVSIQAFGSPSTSSWHSHLQALRQTLHDPNTQQLGTLTCRRSATDRTAVLWRGPRYRTIHKPCPLRGISRTWKVCPVQSAPPIWAMFLPHSTLPGWRMRTHACVTVPRANLKLHHHDIPLHGHALHNELARCKSDAEFGDPTLPVFVWSHPKYPQSVEVTRQVKYLKRPLPLRSVVIVTGQVLDEIIAKAALSQAVCCKASRRLGNWLAV